MSFVLDASAAAAYLLADETVPEIVRLRLASDLAYVPVTWPAETASALLAAYRRGRIDVNVLAGLASVLARMEVEAEELELERWAGPVLRIAQERRLTVYDAAYLEIAFTKSLPLATLDAALRRAASEAGVAVLE